MITPPSSGDICANISTSRVQFQQFYLIDGTDPDVQKTFRQYADLLRGHQPRLCLLGIGENGHLAFNDPAEAIF